jgi:hypothetical protein
MRLIIMTNCPKGTLIPVFFGVVTVLAYILVVTTLSQHVMATNQTTTYGNTTHAQFLFVQSAGSGSLSQINETAYTLELNDVADKTILFSDRPERLVETVGTTDFVGNWTTGPNNFAADAPNDASVYISVYISQTILTAIVENIQSGNLETAIIESFNPVYDPNTNTLTYTITAENATSMDLPRQFGKSVLAIDSKYGGIIAGYDINSGTVYGN